MAKKGFDLAALAREAMGDAAAVSKLDRVESIPTAEISANGANFYEMTDLEELASSIELVGQLQPVIVKLRPEGGYTLVDGERRFRAVTEVLGRSEISCIVRTPVSDVLEELMLIEANRTQRKMTAADLSRQAERYTELLAALKESGVEIPGRLRDRVAEALQVSASKLARLHAIRKNLEPGLLALFDDGDLNESVAYELSRFDQQKQLRVFDVLTPPNPEGAPATLTAEMIRAAAAVDESDTENNAPRNEPTPAVRSPASLKPKTAFCRRTSIRDAARVLRLDPDKSIQENMDLLGEKCHSHAGYFTQGLDVECKPGRITLDEHTRYERRYTLRAFVELAAEMWIEEELPQVFAEEKRKPIAMDVWFDADAGDLPDDDYDVANIIAWGSAGLTTVPGVSFAKAYAIMPERCRWWSFVYAPEEHEEETK